MPFVPLENGVRVEFVYNQDGQIVENVQYAQFTSVPDASDMAALGLELAGWWSSDMSGNVSNTVHLVLIRIKGLTTDSEPAIEYTTGLPLTGAQSGVALPNNVTLAIKFNTGLAGRSFRGRNYFVGLTEAHLVSQNTVSPATITALVGSYNNLIDAYEAASFLLVVASFFHGVDVDGNPIPRAAGIGTVVTGFTIDSVIDSQRRRLPNRGT